MSARLVAEQSYTAWGPSSPKVVLFGRSKVRSGALAGGLGWEGLGGPGVVVPAFSLRSLTAVNWYPKCLSTFIFWRLLSTTCKFAGCVTMDVHEKLLLFFLLCLLSWYLRLVYSPKAVVRVSQRGLRDGGRCFSESEFFSSRG